jgi:hypothetical protein
MEKCWNDEIYPLLKSGMSLLDVFQKLNVSLNWFEWCVKIYGDNNEGQNPYIEYINSNIDWKEFSRNEAMKEIRDLKKI